MEFWGIEVKGGEKIVVPPKDDTILRVTQASLGEVKKDKADLAVYLNMHVGDQKIVIGTLSSENPQVTMNMSIKKELVLSHDWKNGSVYFLGCRGPSGDLVITVSDISSDSDSDFNIGEPLPQNEKSMLQDKGNQPSSSGANAVKPDSDSSDDSDESDSDDDDEVLPAEAKIENAKDDDSNKKDEVRSSTLREMAYQKLREIEAEVAESMLRRDLDAQQLRVAELAKELEGKNELLHKKDKQMDDSVQRIRGLEAAIQERDQELASLRSENEKLMAAKTMYKRISIVNTSSGFETFREVGKRAYPDFDWEQFRFDPSIYATIAEARVLSQDLLLPPTPPSSP